jgi:hypothetical protein
MLEIMTFGILRVIRSIVDSISSTIASGKTHTNGADDSNESLEHSNVNDHDWVQVYHTDCLLGITQCNDQNNHIIDSQLKD